MDDQGPRKPFLSSATITTLLGVVAMFAAIPAPPSWPSLEPPFGTGWWMYVVSIVVISIWLFIGHRQETRRREWEQEQRDTAMKASQRDESDRIIQNLGAVIQASRAVNAQSGPSGKPLASEIENVGSLVARLYAERRHGEVAAISAGATPLLEDISKNPPKTEEEILRAVSSVKAYSVIAETGHFNITGSDARLIHRDKEGNVISEG